MSDLLKLLGRRIKRIRKAARQTQGRLAKKAGLSVEFISRMERGVVQPSLKTLGLVAEALDVEVRNFFELDELVFFQDKKKESQQRAECLDAITSQLKELDTRDLILICMMVKIRTGRSSVVDK